MNISSSIATSLVNVNGAASVAAVSGSPRSVPPPMAGDASRTTISKPGQLLSELQDLAASDPAKFKEVTADLAKKLGDAASQATGSDAAMLGKMADRFEQASQTGQLQPPGGAGGAGGAGATSAHHHHHHHYSGGSASGSSASSVSSVSSVSSDVDQAFSDALTTVSQALATTAK
jgi:hypothetical protein